MAKGVSIKFKSYHETVPKLLQLIKLEKEIQRHNKIVLKPSLKNHDAQSTPVEFVEEVLKYCISHKNSDAQVFIAEGSDGEETIDMFDSSGYKALSEKYNIGLLDLNESEIEEIQDGEFIKFESIAYPKILLDSFIISLPKLAEDPELDIQGSLSTMLGAFPSKYYQGIFARKKSKIRKWPIKFSIHDILRCKMPNFAIIDASEQGSIIAGMPLDMDKQAAKLLGKEWKDISHLRLIDESFAKDFAKKDAAEKEKESQAQIT